MPKVKGYGFCKNRKGPGSCFLSLTIMGTTHISGRILGNTLHVPVDELKQLAADSTQGTRFPAVQGIGLPRGAPVHFLE